MAQEKEVTRVCVRGFPNFSSLKTRAKRSQHANAAHRNNSCGYTRLLPKVTQWVIALGWDRFGFLVRFSPPVTL